MPNVINEFRGQHRFLSNFFPSPIRVRNLGHGPFTAPTAEHVFQAFKSKNPDEQQHVLIQGTPGQAKRSGRSIKLRDDWDDIKLNVMFLIVRAKFEQNPHLRQQLIATGDAMLIEGNHWGDTFWGAVFREDAEQPGWEGHNHLGIILMQVREELRSS